MNALRLRSVAIVAVAALSALFGTVLVQSIAVITSGLDAAGMNAGVVTVLLSALGVVFFGISLYVGAIVTANGFSTVLAGRTRDIALLRLVGATAPALRRRVVVAGLRQGVVGSLAGCAVGVALTTVSLEVAFTGGWMERFEVPLVTPALIAPVLGVVVSTVLASIAGSRPVLEVSPMEAVGAAVERPWNERGRVIRIVAAVVLLIVGSALFAVGIVAGLETPLAVLPAFVGGVVSSSGIVIGAPVIIPPVLRRVGRLMGTGPVAVLASENAVRHPVRASRATVGLGIGVTLVTTFATVLQQFRTLAGQFNDVTDADALNRVLDGITAVLLVLVGFSALLAAVGMVSTVLQSVLQRRRELGLLRALGFTAAQVRRMVAAEGVQIVVTATVVGILLGSAYGWAGAQAAFGQLSGGFLPVEVPVLVVGGLVVVTAAIALASSLVAARAATRVTPIEALSVA